jgi:rare lipoprotein A
MKVVYGICAAIVLAATYFVGTLHAYAECGIASTYSSGSRTANGEAYDHTGISAAHKSLPFGSRVVVRNQRTGRSITVRINDRGPFVAGRIIDLSTGAKNALGMGGLASVCLEVVSYGSGKKRGYEKPGLGGQLLEALNPGKAHEGRATAVRSAKGASTKTRLASVQTRRRHKHHDAEYRENNEYASSGLQHRRGGSRKASRRRQYASYEF